MVTDNHQSRERFESVAVVKWPHLRFDLTGDSGNEMYDDPYTEALFDGWQAALASQPPVVDDAPQTPDEISAARDRVEQVDWVEGELENWKAGNATMRETACSVVDAFRVIYQPPVAGAVGEEDILAGLAVMAEAVREDIPANCDSYQRHVVTRILEAYEKRRTAAPSPAVGGVTLERLIEIADKLESVQIGLRLAMQEDCDLLDELYSRLYPNIARIRAERQAQVSHD